ncbi:MAG: hypothetical protein ACRDID_09865, partial [Ktedonobacterales bacterium]
MPGVIWQTIHYLLGFKLLGYDVYYVEAHSRAPHMFHDSAATTSEFMDGVMRRFGLGAHWAYHALGDGACYGMSVERLQRVCREAELVIN